MVRKYKYFANIIKKLNLKKDTGTSFESQQSCRIIKKKSGKENFSFEAFTEDTVANAFKNLLTGKASVFKWYSGFHYEGNYWCLLPKANKNNEWLFEKHFFPAILKKCWNNSLF